MTPKRKPVAKATPLQVAMKNVKEVLDKDKSTGWQPRVQSWAAGSKKLERLMLDPAFSSESLDPFHSWAEDELLELVTGASVKVFLAFFLIMLDELNNQRLKPVISKTQEQSHEVNQNKEREASPAGISARIGKAITLIAKSIQQILLEERTETNAKELYTKQWSDMLIALLDACMSRNMRNEELECILCEIIYHIASSSTTDQGRQLLKADEVLGFEKLGSYLFKSDISRTSILLLRLLVCLLPALATKVKDERAIALRKVIVSQRWDAAVRKDVFQKIGKIVDVYWPDQLMITINALAKDESHIRPRAYQVTSLFVDKEDQLESNKSKRYIETGQLIIYLDRWAMICVAYDVQGAELDIFFYLKRIVNLVRQGPSGFNFRYEKEAGGQVEIRLEIRTEQADDFLKFANTHLRTMKNNSIMSAETKEDNAFDVPAINLIEIDRTSEQDESGGVNNKTTQDTSSLQEDLSPSISNREETPVARSNATVQSSTQSQGKTAREVPSGTEQRELKLAESSKGSSGRSKRKAATAAEINVTKQLAGEISIESDPNSFEQEYEDIEDTAKTPPAKMKQDLERLEQSRASNASASQQLAIQSENAMTGSARKSDKTYVSRAALRPKTIVDSDSDPDEPSQPSKEPIPAPTSKINLAKSKSIAKSSTFKTPKPRSSAPATLHSQIQQGSLATPASAQASKSKGRERTKNSDENAENNESEIGKLTPKQPKPPKTLPVISRRAAVPPATPRKLPAKSRSQQVQHPVEEDDTQNETEKHPPLPWESEAVGVVNMPKSSKLPRTTESRSAPFPAGSIAAAQAQSLGPANDTDDLTQLQAMPEAASSISPPVSPRTEGDMPDEEAAPETPQDKYFSKLPRSAEISGQTVELAKNANPHNTALIKGHPATSSSLPILPSFAAQVGSSSQNSTTMPAVISEHQVPSTTIGQNGSSNNLTKAAPLDHHESDPSEIRVVPQMDSKNSSKPPKTSAKNTKQNPSPSSTSIIGKKRDLPIEIAEDETQSINSTPRPVISRKSVEAMFKQQEEDEEEQEERVSKKARIALLPSSSAAEEDTQPARTESRKDSGENGSVAMGKEKGRKRKSAENAEKNDEGKISRRRSSGSADVKALNESERLEQRAMNEFDATLSQIADLIRIQSQNRLTFPSKQAKVAKSQFGKLAKNLIDDFHKESKNQIKILNSRSQIAHEKYENWRKTDIRTMLNDYTKTKADLDEAVSVDKKAWEFKEVLFS